jgi:hypothetical protein
MRPALVMPPIAALGRQQSILAPAGTYSARRFMLVSDIHRLYIAQGRLLSLDMQTPAVELFQYEIDPYPYKPGPPRKDAGKIGRPLHRSQQCRIALTNPAPGGAGRSAPAGAGAIQTAAPPPPA